jgi:hypothetical protein
MSDKQPKSNVKVSVPTNPTTSYVVSQVNADVGVDPYFAVTHGDSGSEIVRCADYATALKEKARLDKQLPRV